MPKRTGRDNQRRRTRKDLLDAAAALLKEGRGAGIEEIAARARVSRATAYRYFPNLEALLIEAPLDGVVPGAEIFGRGAPSGPEERVDMAEEAMHQMCYRNEAQLRLMLGASLGRGAPQGIPVRQNRRTPLIEAALAPARGRMSAREYKRLCAALAMLTGPEAMIVCKDVLGLDERAARKVKSWAVRVLVRATLEGAGRER